jgi:probable O-glycosylation ligase (exosortase A-associated)
MRSIVVLIFVAVAMLVALYSRFVALLLYWWIAIFRPHEWVWMDVSQLKLSFVAGLILVIPCFLTGKFPRLGHVISYLMLAWLALAAFSTYFVGCGSTGWRWLDHVARLMLVLFLTNRLVYSPKRIFWLGTVISCSIGFFSAKYGFFSLLRGGVVQHGFEHVGGALSGSNAFALGTAMCVFLMIATAQNASNPAGQTEPIDWEIAWPWMRMFQIGMWVMVPLSIYQVVSLFSRGSALGLASGFLVFLLLQERRVSWFLKTLPVLLIAVLLVPLPAGYKERISTVYEEPLESGTSAGRIHFWKVAADIAADYPFGIGPGCYPLYYDNYDYTDGAFGRRRSVHSSHFQVLVEAGYLGAVVWVLLFLFSFGALARVRRRCQQGLLSPPLSRFYFTYANAVISLMVVFIVGGQFYEIAHADLIWLGFMLAVILDTLSREQRSETVGEDFVLAAADGDAAPARTQRLDTPTE